MADKAILRSNTYLVGAGGPGDVEIHSNDGSINVTKESKTAFNIEVANQASNEWGKITGDIYQQTDLQELVGTKQDKLTQGSGITISPENVISADIDLSEYAKKSEIPNSYDKSETYTKDEVNNIADGKADKGDSYTKSESDAKYQPKGNYLTPTDISDMETMTHASATYQPKGDYALNGTSYTKNESDAKYALKGDVPTDVYTKTEADEKFATKEEIPDPYTLPVASETVLGGIKVGDNLTIDEDGTLNANVGESNVAQFTRESSIDDINAAIDAGKVVCIIDDERVYWFDRRNADGNYLYFYSADTYSGFLYSLSYQGTYWSRQQTVVQKKLTAGENITIQNNVISATGGLSEVSWGSITGTLDDQTDLKDALDGKQPVGDYALKSEVPDVSTLIPKTVSGSYANWNWSFSDNPTNMGLKFEGTAAPTGASIGVDLSHASMPGGYIELNAIPGAPTSGKKVVLTPSGIDFTRTDGSTYQPVYTDTIGSTYGVYTDKLTKIDSRTNGYYIDTKKMQMWNGGTADAPLGPVAKISSGSVVVAQAGQYETSTIPVSKLEGSGLTVSLHGQSIGASVGLNGVKYTTTAGVTHSLENKQDKLTFATDTQIDALFA